MDLTSRLAREAGITTEELTEIFRYRESALFTPAEKDVLELSEAASKTPARIPPELLDRLRSRYSEAQLVELASAIALQNFSARFNRTLLVE